MSSCDRPTRRTAPEPERYGILIARFRLALDRVFFFLYFKTSLEIVIFIRVPNLTRRRRAP